MIVTEKAQERIRAIKLKLEPRWIRDFENQLNKLKSLAGEAKLHLHVDNEPYSFQFYITGGTGLSGLHGGLIFHHRFSL